MFDEDNDSMLSHLEIILPEIVSQSGLQELIDELAFSYFIMDYDEERVLFSSGMQDVIGKVASQDMLIEAYAQYFPEKERSRTLSEYMNAMAILSKKKLPVVNFEHAICKNFEETLWVKVLIKNVNFEKNNYAFGLLIDKSKSMSDRILSQLMSDGISAFVYHYDSITDICYINTYMMEALDLKRHYIEHASSEILKIIHPDDHAVFVKSMESFLQRKTPLLSGDFRFLSPTRGEIWVHAYGASDFDSTGTTRYITGLLIDITDKMKADYLQKNIIEGTSAIVYTADLKRNELVFSENLRQIFPDADLEIRGDLMAILTGYVIAEDRHRFREPIEQVIEGRTDRYSVEFRVQRADGKRVWLASRGKAFYDSSMQTTMLVGTIFDLSSMNEVRELVEKTNYLHEISGLPTRGRLLLDTEKVIHDRNVLSAAVILFDIKGFHTYNDRFGRNTGDEILLSLSKMLQDRLPSGAELYHIGIDTYAMLWAHATRVQIERFMEFMQEEAIHPVVVGKDAVFVSFSMSAALFPSSGNSADELLVNAEITLHKVKQDNRKKHAIFCPTDKRELKERLDFEFQLSRSIRNGKDSFYVFYQPLVNATTGEVDGAEALLRWKTPGNDEVRPEKVIAALEATGQMDAIGRWILETAISQCGQWLDAGVKNDFFVHVNVTAEDLAKPNYAESVLSLLQKYSVNAGNIILEITETSLMRSIATCRQNLIRLRKEGIKIALDDFGTGYSSLNYLRELPIDEIKIDRAFIEDIHNDRFNRSFISAIVLLAHSISKTVCVEGVEDKDKAQSVKALNADLLQGYYFGRPMSPKDFESRFFKKKSTKS
ncbi:MAG: EAL domain-containing protein [Clostridiaceae bacterium]|nr:EAL domain-containing protein [Clostridiaceae bacterium]